MTGSIMRNFIPKLKCVGALTAITLYLSAAILPATAADDKPAVVKMRKNDVTPIAEIKKPVSVHAPFQDGDCSLCHERKDSKNPGPVIKQVNALCLDCHDDYTKVLSRKYAHEPARVNCVSCHSPHNAMQPKLLVEESGALCLSCHTSVSNSLGKANVKHDALTQGAKCMNCHNPHGANVEHLLNKLPYDLCVSCHGQDAVKDQDGKALTNFKKLLAENPEQHGPVASKDCSACHLSHGGDHFRLLIKEYPAQFYSPYDLKLYDLCFDCHEASIVQDPKTTTLTKFRNGDQNLHYLHVNKDERGRTCRACHEVHASKQKHQIRDAVPYGRNNYMLKVNFTPTANGGMCAQTCHAAKSYTNSVAPLVAPKADAPAPPAKSP